MEARKLCQRAHAYHVSGEEAALEIQAKMSQKTLLLAAPLRPQITIRNGPNKEVTAWRQVVLIVRHLLGRQHALDSQSKR